MSNPQVENGHTRVANEILENIMKVSLNGTQFRIVMAVWRFTYGFQMKERELSVRSLAVAINAQKTQVERELGVLIDRKILEVSEAGARKTRKIRFNKHYEEWTLSGPARQQPVEIKKPKKKKPVLAPSNKYPEDNTYYKMAVYFHKKVSKVAEEAGVQHLVNKANMQKWADDFRKLTEIDHVDKRLAKNVMDWVTQDSFWKTNILSAKKLREKFPELAIKMQGVGKPQAQPVPQRNNINKEIEFQRWQEEGNDPDAFNWGD